LLFSTGTVFTVLPKKTNSAMSNKQSINKSLPQEEKPASASTGNASNPSPHDDGLSAVEGTQLLNGKAEKYLREAASIEDVPDATDQQEMDDTLTEEK
jgi:hypothetical protein